MSDVDLDLEQEEVEAVNDDPSLGMSDEEFMKMDLSQREAPQAAAVVEETEEEQTTDEEDTDEADESEQSDESDTESGEQKPESVKAEESDTDETSEAESKKPESEQDYKAVVDRLFAPFKANGREMRIDNVDDAIALMQMGANYNKKMAALKPNLKLLKLLENNSLLSEEKISFLIDLDKKDPAAISKLLKDSGIDPLDVDVDKAKEYAPRPYTVDDREIELDSVLEEIQDTPTYTKTVNVVSTKWDAASKQVIADNPQLLKVINDHVATGIYDLISNEIERERTFGRLNGLSDIEAYKQVGDSIQARGGFAHLAPASNNPQPKVAVQPKPKAPTPDLRDKKRAASSPKPAVSAPAEPDFNPLAMSDEEYSKLVKTKFM